MEPDELIYPPKPQEPLASDCCGNGCTPCVLDIYQQELEMWEAECNKIQNGETSMEDDNTLEVYPTGLMSNAIKSWLVGDKIDMRGPVGNKIYSPNKYRKVLMLCAGTGIAPMCQVINSILDNEEDETLIRLVYACKNYTEILIKPEILEWRRYWNFSCVFILSQEPAIPGDVYRYGEEIIKGHIDETMVHDELGDHLEKMLVLICGTRSFDSDMLGFARTRGVPEESLHKF